MYFYDFQTICILLIPHSHIDTLQAEHQLLSSPHTQHCNTASPPSLLFCGSRDHFPGASPLASHQLLGLSGMDA